MRRESFSSIPWAAGENYLKTSLERLGFQSAGWRKDTALLDSALVTFTLSLKQSISVCSFSRSSRYYQLSEFRWIHLSGFTSCDRKNSRGRNDQGVITTRASRSL